MSHVDTFQKNAVNSRPATEGKIVLDRQLVETPFGFIHVISNRDYDENLTPLLCLHMSGHSANSFANLIAYTSGKRRIIAFDYPGYGHSDKILTDQDHSIENYAEIAFYLLGYLNISKVNLFGHHTGAKVAVQMASTRPREIHRIILAGVSAKNAMSKTQSESNAKNTTGFYERAWNLVINLYAHDTPINVLISQFEALVNAGPQFMNAQHAAGKFNVYFGDKLRRLNHQVTVINLNDELVKETPKIIKLLKYGRLINKLQWTHGFLEIYANYVYVEIERALA